MQIITKSNKSRIFFNIYECPTRIITTTTEQFFRPRLLRSSWSKMVDVTSEIEISLMGQWDQKRNIDSYPKYRSIPFEGLLTILSSHFYLLCAWRAKREGEDAHCPLTIDSLTQASIFSSLLDIVAEVQRVQVSTRRSAINKTQPKHSQDCLNIST